MYNTMKKGENELSMAGFFPFATSFLPPIDTKNRPAVRLKNDCPLFIRSMDMDPQVFKPSYHLWRGMSELIELADGYNDLLWRNIGKKFGRAAC